MKIKDKYLLSIALFGCAMNSFAAINGYYHDIDLAWIVVDVLFAGYFAFLVGTQISFKSKN